MSVHDAQPGDIYVDANGKLWRCITTCQEPTVQFEEVEGCVPAPPNLAITTQVVPYIPSQPQIVKARQSGGVGGLMWRGWKRI